MLPVRISNPATNKQFEFFAFADTGANGEVMSTELAKLLNCVVERIPGTLTTFHGDAKTFDRQAVRDPVILHYGDYQIPFKPDVVRLVTTEYLLVGRPMLQNLHISLGPIATEFPPLAVNTANETPFQDVTVRFQRVEDLVKLSRDEESQREEFRHYAFSLLARHVELVPIDSHINAPEAIFRVEHAQDTQPAYVRQYDTKPILLPYVDAQISLWLQNKKIRPWDPGLDGSRPHYNIPLTVAVTRKPDGEVNKARVCADATRMNIGLLDEHHPLPSIPKLYAQMAGRRFHSSLDATSCFLQFPVLEEHQRKLAFTWRGAVYVFTCLIFGLKSASQFVQRVLSQLFADMSDFLQIYVDDLIISSNTLEEHMEHLSRVIERCNEINFLLSPDKCALFMTSLRTLGNRVSGTQIVADPEKIQAILNFPVPTTRAQLVHQLAVANFQRQFVRDYGDVAAPLHALCSTKNEFQWTDAADKAHAMLLHAMAHLPALRFIDFSKPFAVACDSSIVGIGGVLFQPTCEGEFVTKDNVVAICTRKLHGYETRWSVYKLELGALIYCLRCFEDALSGRFFIVYTDCKAITYMRTQAHGNRILDGWKSILDEFDFKIFHISGHRNTLADSLSRSYSEHTWGVPPSIQITPPATPARALDRFAPANTSREIAAAQTSGNSSIAAPKSVTWSPVLESTVVFAPQSPPATSAAAQAPTGSLHLAQAVKQPMARAAAVGHAISPRNASLSDDAPPALPRPFKTPSSAEHALMLVQDAHEFGHFGTRSVHAHLRESGYRWPNMNTLIAQVCADCAACRSWSKSKHAFAPLRSPRALLPWQVLQIDLITSLEMASDGSRYVLVVICTFTSFMLLYALPDKTAEIVAEALWNSISIFGPPQVLQSDNDAAFLNSIVAALIASHGIEHRLIAAYTPRMAGKVERAVGVISTLLHKLVAETGKEWPSLLPWVQLTANQKIRNLTGLSPCAMLLNTNAQMYQSFLENDDSRIYVDPDVEALVAREKMLFETVFPMVVERTKLLKDKQERSFDGKHLVAKNPPPTGTLVMLLDSHRANKSEPPYVGPYTIVRRTHAGLYTLRDDAGGIYPSDVPLDHLKILTGATTHLVNQDATFYVDRIVAHKKIDGSMHYLVQWVGEDEPSWEPQSNIDDTTLIRNYFSNLAVLPHSRDARPRTAPPPSNFSVRPPARLADGALPVEDPVSVAAVAVPSQPRPKPARAARSEPVAEAKQHTPIPARPSHVGAHYLWNAAKQRMSFDVTIVAIHDADRTATFAYKPPYTHHENDTRPWSELLPAQSVEANLGPRTRVPTRRDANKPH